jgi:hypothetical protein
LRGDEDSFIGRLAAFFVMSPMVPVG